MTIIVVGVVIAEPIVLMAAQVRALASAGPSGELTRIVTDFTAAQGAGLAAATMEQRQVCAPVSPPFKLPDQKATPATHRRLYDTAHGGAYGSPQSLEDLSPSLP